MKILKLTILCILLCFPSHIYSMTTECQVVSIGPETSYYANTLAYSESEINVSIWAGLSLNSSVKVTTADSYYRTFQTAYYYNGAWSSIGNFSIGRFAAGVEPTFTQGFTEDGSTLIVAGYPMELPEDCDSFPPDCGDAKELKIYECGGVEHFDPESWDSETCTGKCICEDGLGVTYQQIKEFCEGNKNTSFIHNASECTGECSGDCSYEYSSLERECGLQGIATWDQDNCSGTCNNNCSDEYTILETECGISGVNQSTYNYENCTGECRTDCTTQYNELEQECGILGIAWFDDDLCSGLCKDCSYEQKECSKDCSGFIKDFECSDLTNSSNEFIGISVGDCVCVAAVDRYLSLGDAEGNISSDYAGYFGGTVTQNADGSKTETLDNGSTVDYINASVDRPRGSILYKSHNGSLQEHYTTADGDEVVIAYDEETGVATETITESIDGSEIVTTTVLEDYSPSGGTVGNASNDITITPDPEFSIPEETGEVVEPEEEYIPEGDPLDIAGRINFAPLVAAASQFTNKYPFAIVDNLTTLVQKINVSPVTPSWTIDLIPAKYGGSPIDMNLSAFDGVAELIRWFLALGLWAAAIWACIKIWTR